MTMSDPELERTPGDRQMTRGRLGAAIIFGGTIVLLCTPFVLAGICASAVGMLLVISDGGWE